MWMLAHDSFSRVLHPKRDSFVSRFFYPLPSEAMSLKKTLPPSVVYHNRAS